MNERPEFKLTLNHARVRGTVTVRVTSGTTIYVDLSGLVVNGVPHRGSYHLTRGLNGWAGENYTSLHLYRPDAIDTSFAARNRVRDEVRLAVNAAMDANPGLLLDADKANLGDMIERLILERAEHQQKIRDIDAKLDTLSILEV